MSESITRKVTEKTKKEVAGMQRYKCANNNGVAVPDYECPLWKNGGDGSFDELGYDIDHIIEFCISHNDNIDNLQALCKYCHMIKTKRFMKELTKMKNDYKNNANNSKTVENGTIVENCNTIENGNTIENSDKNKNIKVKKKDKVNITCITLFYNTMYFCIPCNMPFQNKTRYRDHVDTTKHENNVINYCECNNIFLCGTCCGLFSCQYSLDRHSKTCIVENNIKVYEKYKKEKTKCKQF